METGSIAVRSTDPLDVHLPTEFHGDVIVLPREVDVDGCGVYHDTAITLVKEFKALGVSASYAHDTDERAWYGEKSYSRDVVDWVIGVASSAGWAGLCALLSRGHGSSHVRVRVARCRQTAQETTWEWYEAEGRGSEIAAALAAIERPEDSADHSLEETEEA